MEIETAKFPFFTDEEMVSVLELESDYVSNEGNQMRLQRLSMAASGFLFDRTGYDWSADEPKDPTAVDCAELFVKQRFYENTEYAEANDYQLGITADIRTLIMKVHKAKAKEGS